MQLSGLPANFRFRQPTVGQFEWLTFAIVQGRKRKAPGVDGEAAAEKGPSVNPRSGFGFSVSPNKRNKIENVKIRSDHPSWAIYSVEG